mgnify:FL=1
MTVSVDEVFDRIIEESTDTRQQGTRWERAVQWFLTQDPAWRDRFEHVWMWDDAPTNPGRQDTGIDLVAQDMDGEYWAIQAKCYSKTLSDRDVSTFFMASMADDRYRHFIIADTAPAVSHNLETYITDHKDRDITRIDLDWIRSANIDWSPFTGDAADTREVYEPRDYQREAIDAIEKELEDHDRALAVMACGTGKTLTSLRLAEELCPGGTVLFLAPSISLVSQTMRGWVDQVRGRINPYVVCSDGKASKLKDDESYGQLSDIPYPATTNADTIAARFHKRDDALNVVFSTYQSIDVVARAQELGLPEFDLVVCDEAHRTTGVIKGEGAFQKIHDNGFIHAAKRVYMTATPRIYDTSAKRKADMMGAVAIASMDDEKTYGRLCYTLGFGKAVEKGILTDYKIVVMNVGEDMLPAAMQQHLGSAVEVKVDDQAKFIGIWKALFDRTHASDIKAMGRHARVDGNDAKRLLRHAIAFASSIKASKQLSNEFQNVINAYTVALGEENKEERDALMDAAGNITFDVDHVDGSMDARTRADKLDRLADDDGACHILSNARCLAEGIDVPALDAIIYLSSRKSRTDIIQSVGRVMRKAEGKEYGYIILPIFVPKGVDPTISLANSPEYQVVWQVVNALRGHDERLEAKINAAALGDTDALSHIVEVEILDDTRVNERAKRKPSHHIGENEAPSDTDADDGNETGEDDAENMMQGELNVDSLRELAHSIQAQIVRKCGTKVYWGEWTRDVADVASARAEAIARLVGSGKASEGFARFLQGLRDSLNSNYTETEAVSVLAQHEITRPIFESLFDNPEVVANNPIVKGMDRALDDLYEAGLERGFADSRLADLYDSVRTCAAQVVSDQARQNLIKEIYNDFFSIAFKDMAAELGIVYTPVEVVDAQLHMVQRALRREFGMSLGDRGVHVLDGFAGTGTYMCRLIEDTGLISDEDLSYKYAHDLHSNEIVPLASMIMDVNIEQSYHSRMGGDYRPFPGALLTDTFQMSEADDPVDTTMFAENTERVEQQLRLPIKVVVGNPPYRAGDINNTGNRNTKYPTLDGRIEATYVKNSDKVNKNSLYDHYIRAFRWASDRIGDSGIVCFVSNGGWLTGAAGAGVRRCFKEEFNSIYVYNLRGNQRTQGEESRREGGKIFASGSRATIAITMLVKNPDSDEHGTIHYRDIGDYLNRDEKLRILREAVDHDPEWTTLGQDKHGDWLDQRDDSYLGFIPLGVQEGVKKLPTGLFSTWSAGVKTQRDAWAYNFSKPTVIKSMTGTIDFYNTCLSNYNAAGKDADPEQYRTESPSITWTDAFKKDFSNKKRKHADSKVIRTAAYRPFCKQYLWFDRQTTERVYQQPKLFPYHGAKNLEIIVSERGTFITRGIPDLEIMHHGQCFPLYWYEEVESKDAPIGYSTLFGEDQGMLVFDREDKDEKYIRHDAITDTGLKVFQEAYSEIPGITKEDIFYYVYGILHSREYRRRFENNLAKELPRIPLAANFPAFRDAGRKLAKLHLDYEKVKPWDVTETGDAANPGRTVKMTYPRKVTDPETGKKVKDLTVLQVAENLTIEGIPPRAYEYVVNGKTAIGWLIDRYQVTTDKKSGIVNDPNEYSKDPRYIVDLVEKVIRVSVETVDIMNGLPPLNEKKTKPARWPAEWNR